MKTQFLGERTPTPSERKKGAEIVFMYVDEYNNTINVFGATCHESWEQWGAPTEILYQNVDRIEKWRKKQITI